jgi:sugar phosphate isomerase/epimerase
MSDSQHGFGICVYGIQYLVGAAGHGTDLANRAPLSPIEFLDLAAEYRLSAVEFPLFYPSGMANPGEIDRGALEEYAAAAADRNLRVVVAGGNVAEATDMARQLELARAIGATVFRCTMSRLLRGDRAPAGGYAGWQQHVDLVIEKLREIAPVAERLGVRVGVENHQDADSDDFLRIFSSVGSDHVGLTLDAGNPLAVAEDPVEFASKLADHLVDVHLKDYRMILTDEGYRLVHCAIGDGVVDFTALWKIFDRMPDVPRSIEMASLNERHIRLLTDEWWMGFGDRDVRRLVPVMRLMREQGVREDDPADWQTPIESGDVSGAAEWEMDRFKRSVSNLARIELEAHGGA